MANTPLPPVDRVAQSLWRCFYLVAYAHAEPAKWQLPPAPRPDPDGPETIAQYPAGHTEIGM